MNIFLYQKNVWIAFTSFGVWVGLVFFLLFSTCSIFPVRGKEGCLAKEKIQNKYKPLHYSLLCQLLLTKKKLVPLGFSD